MNMDMKIETFNWEIKSFLSSLGDFRKNINKANESTLNLLSSGLDAINSIVDEVEIVDNPKKSDPAWLAFDDTKFEFQKNIFCRICKKTFAISRREYILHVASTQHNEELVKYNNECDRLSQAASAVSKKTASVQKDRNIQPNNSTIGNNPQLKEKKLQNADIQRALTDDCDDLIEIDRQKVQQWLDSNSNKELMEKAKNQSEQRIDSEQASVQSLPSQSSGSKQPMPSVFDVNIFNFIDNLNKPGNNNCTSSPDNNKHIESIGGKHGSSQPPSTVGQSNAARPTIFQKLEELFASNSSAEKTEIPWQNGAWRQQTNENGSIAQSKTAKTSESSASSVPFNPTNGIAATISNSRFTKPCPAYEMMNLYNKYPHLNRSKMLDPLKPSHETITSAQTYSLKNAQQRQNKSAAGGNQSQVNHSNGQSSGAAKKIENKPANANGAKLNAAKPNAAKPNAAKPNAAKPSDTHPVTVKNLYLTVFFESDLNELLKDAYMTGKKITENSAHTMVTSSLQKLAKKSFGNIKCYLMGSRVNGTTSDENASLDIYLDLHESFHNDKAGAIFVQGMNDVHKLMNESKDWSDAKCTEQTRFGILTAIHTSTKLKCRFTFGTGVFVRNNELIQCFLDIQKICRPLIFGIRLAMENVAPSWTKKFNGYIISLLVIFYFQSIKQLPSVSSLQQKASKLEQCGENTVSYMKPTDIPICKARISELMIGFFEFYAKFDFSKNIISPFEGVPIKHNIHEANENSMSKSILRFKRLIEKEAIKWQKTNMCTQDIFMHKNNVTQLVYSSDIKEFKDFCNESLNILRKNVGSLRY